ncbi:MAG: nucleotidyl transferase AbiEii/AbiGii toxin family protein, partial [Gemmatimonas sp.]|nr:nucleotidyl transferase AbiEii/AbiGii toxin family protein [Gemmatimonas sp.]
MKEICAIDEVDGIVFDPGSIRAEQIRGGHEQVGVRMRVEAGLAGARIPMQIDVGFGDAMIVDPLKSMYPTLLDHSPPMILVYPREAVIAEKLDAMMTRGVTNTRMKDFYDV